MLQRKTVEIAQDTWLISEFNLVNSFLLVGSDRCLLIDCGLGLGNLLEDIRKITEKPVQAVLTHGHFDHIGGSALFETIALHPSDHAQFKRWYQELIETELLNQYIRTRLPVRDPQADPEELIGLPRNFGEYHLSVCEDGTVFSLGNREIETIHTPGHTQGSLCFLDSQNKILFSGDMCNEESLLLNFPDSASVKTYHESMQKIWQRSAEFEVLAPGHSPLKVFAKQLIQDYIRASAELVSGSVALESGQNTMHSGYKYQSGNILIWYDPAKLQ